MTKKVKFALFMLAGTALNIVLTGISIIVLFLLYTVFLVPHIPADKASIGIPILFVASFAIAFISYRKIVKAFLQKHPLDQKDEP
ncbi:MAG: hypothetical protein LBB72_08045 [Spirochaetaceae bacterium]|jgi:energy-coupling factor transporter transmembrane protein EcfT|nr:hypothetical protein [Spirochaetaceae bacterium]